MELERLEKQINLLSKAYKTLEIPLREDKFSDLEKDGVIQRFEYTIELTWKTLKKVLDYEGIDGNMFPKEILKEFYKRNYITDLELWHDFLKIRNLMSHMYSEYTSIDGFEFIKLNHKEIGNLIEKLKKIVNS